MKRKIIIGIIIIAILSLIVYSATIDNFVSQDDPFNITYAEGGGTETEYIDIPKYAYAKNITIKIEGFQLP